MIAKQLIKINASEHWHNRINEPEGNGKGKGRRCDTFLSISIARRKKCNGWMHVLRLQSCDTFSILMHEINVWSVLLLLLLLWLYSIHSLEQFVFFSPLISLLWHQLKQPNGYCQPYVKFSSAQFNIHYLYSDNYRYDPQVNFFYAFAWRSSFEYNEYACFMRTKFNWQHTASMWMCQRCNWLDGI